MVQGVLHHLVDHPRVEQRVVPEAVSRATLAPPALAFAHSRLALLEIAGSSGNTGSSGTGSTGSKPRIISSGSPFAGRQSGGLPRSSIYSGNAYGSGYGSYRGGAGIGFLPVAGLGLGFGYYPLLYGNNYYGGGEVSRVPSRARPARASTVSANEASHFSPQYGRYSNSARPGGPLAQASFNPPSLTSISPPQYAIYGDSNSIDTVMRSISSDCKAITVIKRIALNDDGIAPNTNTTLLPQINPVWVQSYYRASSFALSSYFTDSRITDPAALVNFTEPSTKPFLYEASLRDPTFEGCLNQTISRVLPIEGGSTSFAIKGIKVNQTGSSLVASLVVVLLSGGRRMELVLALVVCVLIVSSF